MPSLLLQARDLVYDALATKRTAGGYSLNDWQLKKTWFPFEKLKDHPPAGILYVIGLNFDSRVLTRGQTISTEIPVQLGFQKKIAQPDDEVARDAQIEGLLALVEEIRLTCIDCAGDGTTFTWLRTEALRDDNETPFHYISLREAMVFENYFTSFYQVCGNFS